MNLPTISRCTSAPPDPSRPGSIPPIRPQFNCHSTSDRLREGSGLRTSPFLMANKLKKDRKSVFKELGLDDDFGEDCPSVAPTLHHPQSCSLGSGKEAGEITGRGSRRRGSKDKLEDEDDSSRREGEGSEQLPSAAPPQQSTVATSRPWYSKLSTTYRRPRMKTASSAPPPTVSGLQKLAMTALLIAVLLPAFSCSSGHEKIEISCAGAGPLIARDISPVNVCARWSQQGLSDRSGYSCGSRMLTIDSGTVEWHAVYIWRPGEIDT